MCSGIVIAALQVKDTVMGCACFGQHAKRNSKLITKITFDFKRTFDTRTAKSTVIIGARGGIVLGVVIRC